MRLDIPERKSSLRRSWRSALRPITQLEQFLHRLWTKHMSPLELKIETKSTAPKPQERQSTTPSHPLGGASRTKLNYANVQEPPQIQIPTATPYRQKPYVVSPHAPTYRPTPPQHTDPLSDSDLSMYLPAKKAFECLDSARVASRRAKAGSNDLLDAVEEQRADKEKRQGQRLYEETKKQ